tara:strand:+ start:5824 stop:6903 length:1080 start_codon:yes stop_codon:yes gene_type:complete
MEFNTDAIISDANRLPWSRAPPFECGGASLVLLGVMSVLPHRVRFAQRMYAAQAVGCVRHVFVVGARFNASEAGPAPLLVTDEDEVVTASHMRRHSTINSRIGTWRKLASFMRFAAAAPEPYVARADDDVFVSLPLLIQYAHRMSVLGLARVYAGVFEWFNFRESSLEAVGFGYNYGTSVHTGKRHGCRADAPPHECSGPYPFAKGPLLLMSAALVRDMVSSAPFRTYAAASGGVVHDDVVLGVSVAKRPSVTYLRIRRNAWHDRTQRTYDSARLLAAHKIPWDCVARVAATLPPSGAPRGAPRGAPGGPSRAAYSRHACRPMRLPNLANASLCVLESRWNLTPTPVRCEGRFRPFHVA